MLNANDLQLGSVKLKKFLCCLLSLILVLSAAGCARTEREQPRLRLVASFYPMYIMLMNITDGIDGVEISSMAGQQTGCLHDFQMQTSDMKKVELADAFIVNGAGMESFLDKVVSELPALTVIDASEGISLLVAGDEEEEEHSAEDGHDHDHGEFNPHLWVSITNCIQQVDTIAKGLMKLDPEAAPQYRANADAYILKLSALRERMHAALDQAPNKEIITFHEAFPYFAKEFGLQVVAVINREPDSEPNARELAETIRLVRDTGVKALFVEPQYPKTAADIVSNETNASVYVLDPAVSGEEEKDAYLDAMERNLQVLEQALGGE